MLPVQAAFRASEQVGFLPKCEKRERRSFRPRSRFRGFAIAFIAMTTN